MSVERGAEYLAMEYIEGPSLARLSRAVQQAEGVAARVSMRILLDLSKACRSP